MNKVVGMLLVATFFSCGMIFPIVTCANERFIPIELWLGENITTSQKLSFPEVDFRFGYKKRHKIKGPINWENSKTKENIRVYVRSRFSKKLNKEISQLWTYTNNNQCLGRVFDNRGNRVIENGCKFPIGFWKEGESRSFFSYYYDEKKGNYERTSMITILNLGKDENSCIEFKWKSSQKNLLVDENVYEYCPKAGLIRVNGKKRF